MLSKVGFNNRVSFGSALTKEQRVEFVKTLQQAKEVSGANGHSLLIVHDACLPQNAANNTGVGNLSSEESDKFFSFMKDYMGFNGTKLLPQGEHNEVNGGFYCSYGGSTLSLGTHQVNLDLLTKPEFGNILTGEEFQAVVGANKATDKAKMANYENVLDEGSSHNQAISKAFDRFTTSTDPKVEELKKQFDTFKNANSDWLEPKSIFKMLKAEHKTDDFNQWTNELDKNLFNPDYDQTQVKARVDELLTKNSKEIEVYKFQQFMAEEHLKIGKTKQNEKGLKLFGDCPIGFSKDEVWANPKAFEKGSFIGKPEWGLPALDYNTIQDENSPAAKMLKRKIELFAQRYDGIRLDAAWCYITPVVTASNGVSVKPPQGSAILEMIENTVKKVKGADFDLKNLIYEVEAGEGDFSPFDWANGQATKLEALKNRMCIFSNAYMHEGWGRVKFFQENPKLAPDEFITSAGNHDPIPLYQLSEQADKREIQAKPLAEGLHLNEELLKNNPIEFAKAKFAEVFTTKNSKTFYMNAFGRKEHFGFQADNKRAGYRYKIADTFESDYHTAIQEGRGLNIMDSMAKVFKAKGLDKTNYELYNKIVAFRNMLYSKGAKTEAEANAYAKANPNGAKQVEKVSQNSVKTAVKEAVSEAKTSTAKAAGGNKHLKSLFIAAAAVAAVVGWVFIYKNKNKEAKETVETADATATTPITPVAENVAKAETPASSVIPATPAKAENVAVPAVTPASIETPANVAVAANTASAVTQTNPEKLPEAVK